MAGDLSDILSPLLRNTLEQKRRADIQNTGDYGQSLGEMYAQFMALTALRGLWLAGNANDSDQVLDVTGQGRLLAVGAGQPILSCTGLLTPYQLYIGTQYHQRASEAGLQISGLEAYVTSSLKGLTIGGWFNSAAGAAAGLCGKYTAAGNQKSYVLSIAAGPTVQMTVSGSGANDFFINSAANISAGQWFFAVGRYIPSTEVAIFLNYSGSSGSLGKTTNTTTIPASLFATSTAAFQIGAYNAGANLFSGNWALCFLCAAALTDAHIGYLFARSRAIFGV